MQSCRRAFRHAIALLAFVVVAAADIHAPRAQCVPSWTEAFPPGPVPHPNNAPSMAFDEARGKMVSFGGQYPGGGWDGETWEWNGTAWSKFSGFSPEARIGTGMTYDVAAARVRIFGGRVDAPIYDLSDTQQFNGFSWTQVMTGVPEQRNSVAMTYDRARGRMVLFGGADRFVRYRDTWEWEAGLWVRKATTGPSYRGGAGIAWDPNRGQVILFGGRVGTGPPYYGETWAWDGTTWTLIADTGPARCCMSMAYDPEAGGVILFGGLDPTGYRNDTWFWDGEQWSAVPVAGTLPAARSSAAMSADSVRREQLLFGGETASPTFRNDTWRFRHGLAIVREPVSRPLNLGSSESFKLREISYGAASYQWRKDGVSLFDGPTPSGSVISGATTRELTIGNTSEADLGVYDCVVTNGCNSVTSIGATLHRVWYLDSDADGFGDAAVPLPATTPPLGYVLDASDCDDTDPSIFPGAPEFCDGIDQDCDTVADNAPPPGSRPRLELATIGSATELRWSTAASAAQYDVVRGTLSSLVLSAGDFATSTDNCLVDDLPATTTVDTSSDPVGDGAWYLVRGTTCAGAGTYDDGGAGLQSPRDASVAASPSSCP